MIKGSAGAGDAFASGVLFGLHENWSVKECLRLGACAAASSLFDESCSDGVKSVDEVLKLESKFGLKSI
jgi:sugar/nucleoside kinase (ribokinase family)